MRPVITIDTSIISCCAVSIDNGPNLSHRKSSPRGSSKLQCFTPLNALWTDMLHVAITDETLGLLAILIGLLAYARLFARPTPLIHPLLLASQAAVSEVRQAGESGAYRNWATGRGNPVSNVNEAQRYLLIAVASLLEYISSCQPSRAGVSMWCPMCLTQLRSTR